MKMKRLERLIVKAVIIQFLFLLAAQVLLHKYDVMPELKQLAQYEGVARNSFEELLETFSGK
jgi:hypothetical protein